MVLKVRTIFLSFVFCLLWNWSFYGQFSQHPPEPQAQVMEPEAVPGEGCAGEGSGSDPSAPPGLCLPIDDYLLPLFVAGLFLGAYKMQKLQKI